jgi:hypothetical protein
LFYQDIFDKLHFTCRLMHGHRTRPLSPSRASTRTESSNRGNRSRSQDNRPLEQPESVVIAVVEPPRQTSTLIDVIARLANLPRASLAALACTPRQASCKNR